MERIETINKRLDDFFGHDDLGRPIWRVVWSEDQFEKRLTNHTKEGLELLTPRMVELPKYKQYIQERWILERLVIVPDINAHELTVKMSYEPMWVFQDDNGFPLPPKWEACKIVIDTVYAAIGKKNTEPRYQDPDARISKDELLHKEAERIKKLQEDLFGNETDTGDALAHNAGVSYAGLDGRPTKDN